MHNAELPNIYSFSDPLDYLKGVLEARKRHERSFRFGSFSTKAGFKSPSTLSMILNGRRNLSLSVAEKIVDALPLRGRKRKFFITLVQLRSSKTPEESFRAQEALLKLKSSVDDSLFLFNQYRILATWYYPVICVMAGMKNMHWQPEAIAGRLGRGVTPEQVRVAIEDLLRLNLLQCDGDRIVRTRNTLRTGEDLKSVAAYRYHKRMNALSEEALSLPLDEREMNGLTIAIPKSHLPEFKERIRKFRRELNEFYSSLESEADEVYQLNLQLFPLTHSSKNMEKK